MMDAWKPTYTKKEWFTMAVQTAGIALLAAAFFMMLIVLS